MAKRNVVLGSCLLAKVAMAELEIGTFLGEA